MDEVLKNINRHYISLPEDEVTQNKMILESVLDTFVKTMRIKDLLFNAMFERKFYGGSFYDDLKVGHPTEFDIDLLLKIPKLAKPTLIESNVPGYVHLQTPEIATWKGQPESKPAYDKFEKLLLDEQYCLSTKKVLSWMDSIVQKSLNDFYDYSRREYILANNLGIFKLSNSRGGPASTITISGDELEEDIDVDLVACFVFRGDKDWPTYGFRSNPFPSSKPEFFIVPKMPRLSNLPFYEDRTKIHLYWRLSFQEQERALMTDKQTFKQVIKLLKKLRDNFEHYPIASYYIKTVGLHILSQKENYFWNKPLSFVFMTVLKEYRDFLKRENIPYYWYPRSNLLEMAEIQSATLQNYSGRLTGVIADIERNPDKPDTIIKYFLRKNTIPPGSNDREESPDPNNSSCVIL